MENQVFACATKNCLRQPRIDYPPQDGEGATLHVHPRTPYLIWHNPAIKPNKPHVVKTVEPGLYLAQVSRWDGHMWRGETARWEVLRGTPKKEAGVYTMAEMLGYAPKPALGASHGWTGGASWPYDGGDAA